MAGSGLWWERPDLRYRDGRLEFGGRDLAALAAAGTPAYVYRAGRVRENLARLRDALDAARACRTTSITRSRRTATRRCSMRCGRTGGCGIDACSPAEVQLALAHGFREEEISFTGHAVSEADLDVLARPSGRARQLRRDQHDPPAGPALPGPRASASA